MTLVAVLSLGLGLGANIAIFSLLNAVLLRSLPVDDPASLVVLSHHGKDDGAGARAAFSNFPLYEYIRGNSRSYSSVLAFSPTQFRMRRDETSVAISAQWVSVNYFPTLGVRPVLGRTWQASDEATPESVVISDRLWRREFGAEVGVIGRTITLNNHAVPIIGVLPPDVVGMVPGSPIDLTMLLAAQSSLQPTQGDLLTLGSGTKDEPVPTWPLYLVGRLRPQVSPRTAEAEAALLYRQWASHRGASESYISASFARATLAPAGKGLDPLRQRFGAPLGVLMAIAGGVFLIACANVTNLLLVRGASRQHEIAVRSALGASRGRLIQQLLSEGVLLSAMGAVCGALMGAWGSALLAALVATGRTPIEVTAALDWHVLAFAGGLLVLTVVAVGLVPALQISRQSMAKSLNETSSRGTQRATGRWGQILVVFQIAVSLCLLVATGLFVGNFRQITALGVGYETKNLLSVSFDWSAAGYSRAQMIDFVSRAAEAATALPGVEAASATHIEPLGQQQSQRWFSVRGVEGDGPARAVELNVVSGDYFRTLGVPVLQGRGFDSRDGVDAPKVALISESLARLCFPARDPVGQPAWVARDTTGNPLTIVGVVRDVKQRDLRESPQPMLFLPAAQSTAWEMNLVVRTRGDHSDTAANLRRVIAGVSRDVPIRELTTAEAQMSRSLLQERVLASLSGIFGPLAMGLAALGLYGLISYNVACRTREIGVRVALGASTKEILRLVLRQGLTLAAIGIVLGVGGSLLVAGTLRRLLYTLSPYDPVVLGSAVGALGLVAVAACLAPAWRASRIDPLVALRHD